MVGLDLAKSIERLRQAGMKIDNEKETITDIATKNNITPKQVYEIIKPASHSKSAVPDLPPPGFGKKKLSAVCADFELDTARILDSLAKKGIIGNPDKSIKEIASNNNKEPTEIFEMIKEAENGS